MYMLSLTCLSLLSLKITPVTSLTSSEIDNHQRIDAITTEYLQRNFPFLTKTCSKDAVSKFIPLCIQANEINSIEERIKVETAIKLSVCEFENSGLHDWIPKGCFYGQPQEIVECMTGLEVGGQWWTTYSGYYQNLNEICYQYSLPFEQERLLGMFLNVTDMVNDINIFWSNEFGKMTYKSDLTINKHVEDISNFFIVLFNDLRDQDRQFKEELLTSNEIVIKNVNKMHEVLRDDVSSFNNVVNTSLEEVNHLIKGVVTQIHKTNISKDISQLNELKDNAIDLVLDQNQFFENSFEMFRFQLSSLLNDVVMGFTNTQVDTLKSIQQRQTIIDNTLNDELATTLRKFEETTINEWVKFTETIEDDLILLNIQFMDNIDEIDQRLNITINSIDKMEGKLNYLTNYLSNITNVLSIIINLIKHGWFVLVIFILSKVARLLPTSLVPQWIIMSLKIVFMIYFGKFIGQHSL